MRDGKIDELWDKLNQAYHHDEFPRARALAQELLTLLGDPEPAIIQRNIHLWTLPWDALGKFENSIQVGDDEIARKRAEILAGDYDAYPKLLLEAVEYLQGILSSQAERYAKLGKREEALSYLQDVYALAKRYGVIPDEDAQALFETLTCVGK